MKRSLRTQISLIIMIIVLLTISIISLLANLVIERQFRVYIGKQHELKTHIITSSIEKQYTFLMDQWNMDFIHAIGMNALYEGYIVKVYDEEENILWDAQSHDMALCNQIMNEISSRMNVKYPELNGKFSETDYPLTNNGNLIGHVSISYFGPFFMNEYDFRFLSAMNTMLISVGIISLLVSVIIGHILAKRISRPILKTVEVTKLIADGRYDVRLQEVSSTKEIGMLEDSINHLALSLETMEKLRKQLTDDVAHELRTPLTILQSHLEAMAEGVWEATPERLYSCYDETERMTKLVGDLESLAKVEGKNLKLNKQKVELLPLIEKAIRGYEGEIIRKKLHVSCQSSPIEIFADPDRLVQVVNNLLSNGIKYTQEGGCITFELFEKEFTSGFHIQDTGIGISEEELPYIFERFYRADPSRNRMTGGTGIGLTIVKSIVEAHGGTVSVESDFGKGSLFVVEIPKV